jgi:hypothetical protein
MEDQVTNRNIIAAMVCAALVAATFTAGTVVVQHLLASGHEQQHHFAPGWIPGVRIMEA